MDHREFYKATTLQILGQFQLLEFALKHYIGFSYQLIHERLNDGIHFGYTIEDVENYSLERLLNIFAKHNNNRELQKRLNSLREKRNHVAHRSLLVCAGSNYNKDSLEKANEEFIYLEDDVAVCLKEVLDELRTIKGKLNLSAT